MVNSEVAIKSTHLFEKEATRHYPAAFSLFYEIQPDKIPLPASIKCLKIRYLYPTF